MNHNDNLSIALLIFFGLGSFLAVSINDMYPPPLSRTLHEVSYGVHGDFVFSMSVEKIDGRRFENEFIITLVLRNEGLGGYTRILRQPVFDVMVYDTNGGFVLKWSGCHEMLNLSIPVHLEECEEFTEVKSWDLATLSPQDGSAKPLPPGRYYLKGVWLGGPIIETRLVFNLVESFFGGSGGSEVKIEGRDFTAIEQQLTRKVVSLALKDMEQAWKPVHSVSLVYQRTEINPQFASIVPPSDVVIVVKFEMEMEHAAGTITVCVPYSTIEPIRSKLYAGFQSDQLEVDHEWMRRFRVQLRDATVSLTVELGRTQLSSGRLLKLKVGDVIKLEKDVSAPLVGMVEGVHKFRGRPGTYRGAKAFKVEGYVQTGRDN